VAGSDDPSPVSALCNDTVIEVIVIWLFSSNKLNDILCADTDPIRDLEMNPFIVLKVFLDELSRFDWRNFGISVTGLVPLNAFESFGTESERDDIVLGDYDLSLTSVVNEYRERLQSDYDFDGKTEEPKEHVQVKAELQHEPIVPLPVLSPNHESMSRIRRSWVITVQEVQVVKMHVSGGQLGWK
jgi:hypothetical protein